MPKRSVSFNGCFWSNIGICDFIWTKQIIIIVKKIGPMWIEIQVPVRSKIRRRGIFGFQPGIYRFTQLIKMIT